MSFIRDYLFDLEKQERALWAALEYLGITGGAPLALVLYVVIFLLAVTKLPGWESVLLAVGGLVVLGFVLLQRVAFHRFITALRDEHHDALDALLDHGNKHPVTDPLRSVNASLGKMKVILDRF